jgi:hypothetical protein
MKILLAVFLIALASCLTLSQENSAEKDFARDIKKFKVEKYSMGEDATSGYDYLIYKNKTEIVKIRTVWNGGASSQPTVEDVYYEAGIPVLYAKLALTKKQFKSVVKNSRVALPAIEKLYLKNLKLIAWIENGKIIPATDSRWQEKEKTVLELAKEALNFYPTLKELQ